VEGVTAAATGAIAGAAFVLGRRAITDGSTVAIALVTLAIASRLRRMPEPVLILLAGIVGILLKGWAGIAE
jgi:chromate transporter